MSEQLKEVFLKYEEIFDDRGEEIKAYLLKNYKKSFLRQDLIDVLKIDATDRIKKSGFHRKLSSWRNYYENVIISSCIIDSNKTKKRFDFKFIFTLEKLDDNTIDVIEAGLKNSAQLKRNFKFGEALAVIDEMLDLIKNESDRVFNRRLFKARNEILEAEKEHEVLTKKLVDLEKQFKIDQKENIYESMVIRSEELVQITKQLRKGNLTRKYSKILKTTKNRIQSQNELSKLEIEFRLIYKRKYLRIAIDICEKIIQLSIKLKMEDKITKYTNLLNQIKNEIEETKEKVDILLGICDSLMGISLFEDAISKIDLRIKILEEQKVKDYDESINKLREKRKEASAAQSKYIKITDNLADLDRKLKENLKNRKVFAALNYCEGLIDFSKRNDKPELVQKYTQILKQIKGKIDELKKKIESIIEASSKLSANYQFEDAIVNLDLMLKFIGQNLPEYRKKLNEKKNEIITAEEKYQKLLSEVIEIDKELNDYLNNKNYIAALGTCEKILEIPEVSKNPELLEKYNNILEQIRTKIEEIKEKIDNLLEESNEFTKNHRFREAFSAIDSILELIGNQELPKYKKKLNEKRKEIIDAQEDFVKVFDDLAEIDRQLEENLKNNKLMEALSNCDLLIQISESFNNPDLIEKYSKILNEINKKVEEIKNKIDDVFEESSRLCDNVQFEDALSNIDMMLKYVEEQGLPEYKVKLEEKRKEIIDAEGRYRQKQEEINELNRTLEKNLEDDNLTIALNNCKQLLKISEASDRFDLIEKYSKILEKINNEIGKIKNKIDNVILESDELSYTLNFNEALSNLDSIIDSIKDQGFPEYKRRLERKRQEIIDAQESAKSLTEEEISKRKKAGISSNELLSSSIEEVITEKENIDAVLEKLKELREEVVKKSMLVKVETVQVKQKETKEKTVESTFALPEDFAEFLKREFDMIKEKISLNLENLRLGGITTTIEKAVDKIFEDGVVRISDHVEKKLE